MQKTLLLDYDKFIDNRNSGNKQFIYSPFSSTFKNARLEQRKTLTNVVGEICSLSYISKFENNLLLPDEGVLKVLFDNIGINYDVLKSTDMTNHLPKIVKAYLRDDHEFLEEYYEKAQSDFFIAQNKLSTLFYYLAKQMYHECAEAIDLIDNVKSTLNDYQLLILISATIELYIKTNRFKEAKKLIDIQKNMPKEYQELKVLYLEHQFLIALNLKDYLKILPFYYELKENYLYAYPFKKQLRNKMMYLEILWDEDRIYEEIIYMSQDYIPEDYYLEYIYSRFLIMIRRGQYFRVIEEFKALENINEGLICLYAYCVKTLLQTPNFNLNLKDELSSLYKYEKEFFSDNFYENELYFLKLLLMEIEKQSPVNIMDYMKANIIDKIKIYQHRFYTEYFVNTYIELLKQTARYKEVTIFIYKHLDYVKNLNNSQM